MGLRNFPGTGQIVTFEHGNETRHYLFAQVFAEKIDHSVYRGILGIKKVLPVVYVRSTQINTSGCGQDMDIAGSKIARACRKVGALSLNETLSLCFRCRSSFLPLNLPLGLGGVRQFGEDRDQLRIAIRDCGRRIVQGRRNTVFSSTEQKQILPHWGVYRTVAHSKLQNSQ